MITRKAFFIRWLLYTGEDIELEHSVIEVEHIQSGIKSRVLSLEKPVNGCRMRE